MTRQIGLAALLALAVTMAMVSGSWAQTSNTSGSPASSSAKMGGSSAGNTGAEKMNDHPANESGHNSKSQKMHNNNNR
jgi:hypothetical protein